MSSDLGPNVRRLVIVTMSRLAIPEGGGIGDGIEFFSNPEKRRRIMAEADAWVKTSIREVREAAGPNPWREATDEAIAGEILRRVEERKTAVGV